MEKKEARVSKRKTDKQWENGKEVEGDGEHCELENGGTAAAVFYVEARESCSIGSILFAAPQFATEKKQNKEG